MGSVSRFILTRKLHVLWSYGLSGGQITSHLGGQFLLQFGDAPGAVDGAHGFHVPNHVLGTTQKKQT